VFDYIARLVMDQAAEFVISRGGWVRQHRVTIDPVSHSCLFQHSITEIMTPISASEVQPQFPLFPESTSTTPSGTDTTGTTVLHDSAISSEPSDYNAGTLQGSTTLDSIASISNEGTIEDYVDLQPVHKSSLDQRRRMSNQLKVDEGTQAGRGDYKCLEQAVQTRDSSGDYEHLLPKSQSASRQESHENNPDALSSQWMSIALGAASVLFISYILYRYL
jgi:hypothetical protein